jgi:hypothetical protein
LDVTVVEYDDGDNDYDEREGRGKWNDIYIL